MVWLKLGFAEAKEPLPLTEYPSVKGAKTPEEPLINPPVFFVGAVPPKVERVMYW